GAMTLSARARIATALMARKSPNASASRREIVPRGIGRLAVRVITASISESYHMLSTLAAPAPAAIARIATNPRSGSRRGGATISLTSAVNTASIITRGFINVMKWGRRAVKLGREANQGREGIAVALMMNSSNPEICRCEVHDLASTAD